MSATFAAIHSGIRSRLLAIAVLLMPLAGCATLGPEIQPPRLSVVSVGMLSADVFSQQFRVRLHVQNPNSLEIPVTGIEYELFLEGDSFAEGVSNQSFVVPAMGESEFDMSVRTNFVSSIGRLMSRMNGREGNKVSYTITGKVTIDLPFVGDIPFADTGTVDLTTMR